MSGEVDEAARSDDDEPKPVRPALGDLAPQAQQPVRRPGPDDVPDQQQ